MKCVRSVLCAAAVCAGLFSPAMAGPPSSKYTVLFDAVWQAVDEHFYDPSFHGLDWKAIGARYRAKLGAVQNDDQFKALATKMVGELGVSHFDIIPPSTSKAYRFGIGVAFRELNGRNIVSEVRPLSDARAKGIRVGDLLVSPALQALHGELGTTAKLRLEDCRGQTRHFDVARVNAFWPPQHPGFEWSTYSFAPGRTIGYIRIDRFDDGAAALADQAMAELKDTSAIIIDVRDNSGGNLSGMRLASYFTDKPFEVALLSRAYLKPLGHQVTKADIAAVPKVSGIYTDAGIMDAVVANKGGVVFQSEDMGAKRYTKPVVVLIGKDTASAAEGFVWAMHLASKAILVGRPTAGYLLSAEDYDLPDGWSMTIPSQGVWDGTGRDFQDKAVTPDVPVTWTRAELCDGRDPDIEKALALLKPGAWK